MKLLKTLFSVGAICAISTGFLNSIDGIPSATAQTQKIAQNESIIFDPYVFDAAYYLSLYQDLREEFGRNNLSAAQRHWQTNGLSESRQGNPVFNAKYYLGKYGDLAASFGTSSRSAYIRGIDHWLVFGIRECRQGSANFDPRYYLKNNPDVARAVGNSNCKGAIDHWMRHGRKEGRRGAP